MKTRFILFLYLSFLFNIAFGQENRFMTGDLLISKLKEMLPKGWEILSENKGEMIIQKDVNIYVLDENRINAPLNIETKEQLETRIKKNGKQVKPHFEFRYYQKPDDEFINSAKNKNDSIFKVIESLPKKYKIEKLRDNFASSKGNDVYRGNTDEETERVRKYNIEKYNLLDKIIKLPDYISEKYSFYLDRIIGIEDQYHFVYPVEISEEMYSILKIIEEAFIKVK